MPACTDTPFLLPVPDAALGNLNRCPCCWESCGSMPLDAVVTGCDGVGGSRPCSLANSAPVWFAGSENLFYGTPIACRVYWSAEVTSGTDSCKSVWCQYCISNPSGNHGRAWVVQYFCYASGTGNIVTYYAEITDWVCQCAGPRFSFTLNGPWKLSGGILVDASGDAWAVDGGCCCSTTETTVTVPCCENPISKSLIASFGGCLSVDVPMTFSDYYFTTFGIYYWYGTLLDPSDSSKCLNVRLQCDSLNNLRINADCGTSNKLSGVCEVPPTATSFGLAASKVEDEVASCSPFSVSVTFAGVDVGLPLDARCGCGTLSDIPVVITEA